MIKALLLDLGGTLIDSSEQVFPGVQDALTVLEAFETEDHQPLVTCLVSDFTMPEPRTTEAIAAAFADYLKILDKTGLRSFFEPVDERVTLSTHVGVKKPAAAVFEAALKRAKIAGSITETLFITESADHIAAGADLPEDRCVRAQKQRSGFQSRIGRGSWPAAPVHR